MSSKSTHYDVLGVARDADGAAIRKAYLRSSLRCHPDKNPGREEEAKAEFVEVGQAYNVLGDAAKRAAYDRELKGSSSRPWARPTATKTTTNHTQDQAGKEQSDKDFDTFMNMFDETVSGMSEEELNFAMGAASMVAGIIGSIAGASVAKGGKNSFLSSAASMVGSAMASQAASSLVKTVHEDSKQRALERQERSEAIARGDTVEEPTSGENRERVMKDAGKAFQKVAGAAAFMSGGSSSGNGRTNVNARSSFGDNNATTKSGSGNGGGGAQFDWKRAAQIACTVAGACAEMKQSSGGSKSQQRR